MYPSVSSIIQIITNTENIVNGLRKNLRLFIKGNHRYNSIRTGTLPCQTEGVIGSGYFEHSVGSTVIAMLEKKYLALFGSSAFFYFAYSNIFLFSFFTRLSMVSIISISTAKHPLLIRLSSGK